MKVARKRAFDLAKKNKRNTDNMDMSALKGYICSFLDQTGVMGRFGKKLARESTIVEVFKETHCKKIISEDGTISYGEFIHPKATMTLERYEQKKLEKYPDPKTRPIGDKDLWEEVQPRKKGRFYGFGTSFDQEFTMTGTSSISSIRGSHASVTQPEVTALQEALEYERKAREELERTTNELVAEDVTP
ncbi:hypothetical protein L6452_35910 [Arctium lappa]|uniref:Uncharacterized protein n=1 Tax=Arctium lappa TaxID=4217 RepID=A0ACB8Y982_ARCLA|nr:hypothetical protein L6452_35910 [Arctium lappa]